MASVQNQTFPSARFTGNVTIDGTLTANTFTPLRANLEQNDAQKYMVDFNSMRVWDDFNLLLPSAGATDDLGIIEGTFGTNSPTLQTEDLKAAGATNNYARFMFQLPPEYVAGETVTLRAHAGMKTTISDTTATIDFEVYRSDREEGIGSDLVTTSATTINSVTLADIDFVVDPTGLSPGDILDVRVATAINDAATGTAVIGMIGSVEFLLDIKG